MQQLTMRQMSEMDGTGFWDGFLCGAGIIASLAITATVEPVARWTIYSGTVAICMKAIF